MTSTSTFAATLAIVSGRSAFSRQIVKLVLVIGELVLGIFVLMAFTPPLLRPRYPEHTMVALVVVALGVVLFIDGIRRLIRFAKRG